MTTYNDNTGSASGLDTAEAILGREPVSEAASPSRCLSLYASLRKTRVVYGPV